MRNNEYSTEAYKEAILSAGEAGIIRAANTVYDRGEWLPSYNKYCIFFFFNVICSGKPQCAGP